MDAEVEEAKKLLKKAEKAAEDRKKLKETTDGGRDGATDEAKECLLSSQCC